MARLLVVHHTTSPRLQALLEAVLSGAHDEAIQDVTVLARPALAATAIGGAVGGDGATYAGMGGALAGAYLSTALNVVMGAAFGAVIAQTAAAVLVFFVAPTAWALAGPALFKDNANWLDVFGAFGRIAERDLHGMLPETLTAVAVWVVLPTIVGLWSSSRREVK